MEKLTEKGRKLEAKEGYWMLNITKLAPENISHLPYLALKTFKSNYLGIFYTETCHVGVTSLIVTSLRVTSY